MLQGVFGVVVEVGGRGAKKKIVHQVPWFYMSTTVHTYPEVAVMLKENRGSDFCIVQKGRMVQHKRREY